MHLTNCLTWWGKLARGIVIAGLALGLAFRQGAQAATHSAESNLTTVDTRVNVAPSFVKGGDITASPDPGSQSFAGWATAISPGPSNEVDQTLIFLTTNDNSDLFAVQPAISPDGTLTYTLTSNAHGAAIITVTLQDSGGTDNSGVDTSVAQTFTITRSLPVISISDGSVTEGNDGTVNMTFSLRLSDASNHGVAVNFQTADDTGIEGGDYTRTSGTALFNAGQTSLTIFVPVISDRLREADETFFVNLSAPVNAILDDDQGLGTITDDDPMPLLSISDAALTENDTGTIDLVFVVRLLQVSGQTVTVDYATDNGTAITGIDYVSTNGTLIFSPGETNKTIVVPIIGDPLCEPSELFFVNLTHAVEATISDGQGLGTITDNDPVPMLLIADLIVNEGDLGTTDLVFKLQLSNPCSQLITVDYVTADGTAIAGSDYVSTNGTIIFSPGQTNQAILVHVLGDTLHEPNEVFLVNLGEATNATVFNRQSIGTILDDDPVPKLFISDVTVTEGNFGSTNAIFVISLIPASGHTLTVNYATADGTATAGMDYLSVAGSLTFSPGETNKAIAVAVLGDAVNEVGEAFFVNLSNAANVVSGKSVGAGTIVDDDAVPALSITSPVIAEGNSGTNNAIFTVNLTAASSQPIMVDYGTADGTATAGSDYLSTHGSIVFSPGQTTQTIVVPIIGDTLYEADETFLVNLSHFTNATFSGGNAIGTINNDDLPPTISISDRAVAEGHSGTTHGVFILRLSKSSGLPVTVDFATADGTATAGSDYEAANGTLTFLPGALTNSVSVVVIDDAMHEADEIFLVTLANATGATISRTQALGTILNDDPLPTLTITDAVVTEGGKGTTNAVLTVLLSTASSQIVTMDYSTMNVTAMAEDDYVSIHGTLSLPPGTITTNIVVTILGDMLPEPDEVLFVQLGNAIHAEIGRDRGVVTVLNDDATNRPPKIAIINPTDRAIFPPGSDIAVSATASDPDGAVTEVVFYLGSEPQGTNTTSPYSLTLKNVPAGDYQLTARATDNEGLSTLSAPTTIVVSDVSTDVALVRAGAGLEPGTLQDYLLEMGLSSQVFGQADVSIANLQQFQLVIWNDEGVTPPDLSANTVKVFQELFTTGKPLYFVGNKLASALTSLGEPERSQWSQLIRLTLPTGWGGDGMVTVSEADDSHPILKGAYGNVESFGSGSGVELASATGLETKVLGRSGGADVLMAFPENPYAEGERTFTQNCQVNGGDNDSSTLQRKRLFQNVVCWLLRCLTCTASNLNLKLLGPTAAVRVGDRIAFTNVMQVSGDCDVSGVTITNQLSSDERFVTARVEHGTWAYEPGVNAVIFRFGRMTDGMQAEASFTVVPLVSGVLTNEATGRVSGGRNVNSAQTLTTVEESGALPMLSLVHLAGDNRVLLSGMAGGNYRIQVSPDLSSTNWTDYTNVTSGAWTIPLLSSGDGAFQQRFYRAVSP